MPIIIAACLADPPDLVSQRLWNQPGRPLPVVSKAIERCHEAVHRLGAQRIATDIRIGTRTDKPPPTSQGPTENQRKKQSVLNRLMQE